MSGGGGTGDSAFGGGGTRGDGTEGVGGIATGVPGGELPCERLQFSARLRSVNADELAQVEVDDSLIVQIHEIPRPVVAVFRSADDAPIGEPVGVLLNRLSELVPCLTVLPFRARVLSIDGGDVVVHVYPEAGIV